MASKKAKGKRAKSRNLMRKRGPKASVNKWLQEIPIGATVHVKIDSAVHNGLPALIFQGKTGKVKKKRGRSYEVDLMKGNKKAMIVIHPAHLIVKKDDSQSEKKEEKKQRDETQKKKSSEKAAAKKK